MIRIVKKFQNEKCVIADLAISLGRDCQIGWMIPGVMFGKTEKKDSGVYLMCPELKPYKPESPIQRSGWVCDMQTGLALRDEMDILAQACIDECDRMNKLRTEEGNSIKAILY